MEYRYEQNPKQLVDDFECGDLCFGNNPSNIVWTSPELLRLHTSTLISTTEPYPKSSVNSAHYTSTKNVSVQLLSCCWFSISYGPVIMCNGKCRENYHRICMGLDFSDNCNDFVCAKCK